MSSSTGRRGAVAVIRREERLLVIRRSLHVAAPGKVCFPGGGVEPAESDAAALVRELDEELGVAVEPLGCVWQSTTSWGVQLVWWQARLAADATLKPNPAEVAEVDWRSPAELTRLDDLLESNREFLAALKRGDIALAP